MAPCATTLRRMKRLASYVCGRWVEGSGPAAVLRNPATEEPLAECATGGLDFAAALGFARERGGPALRELGFAQRGELLARLAAVVHAGREELIALAVANGGNTRGDAKFDIDGAGATLAAYAELGAQLGDTRVLVDGEGVQLGRSPRLHGRHLWSARTGAAVHV